MADELEQGPPDSPGTLMRMLDTAIDAAGKLARQGVDALRSSYPHLSDAQLLTKVNVAFTSTVTSTGAAAGATAAVPGIGTGVSLVAAAGDASWFLTAAGSYVLAVAELRGIEIHNHEHQRALVLMVMAGGGGSTFFSKAANRTGPHLGKIVTNTVPLSTIRSVNSTLGAHFVTKYGTRRGIITIGKVAPFGIGMVIGAGGNLLMARSVVATTKAMFDSAEKLNAADSD